MRSDFSLNNNNTCNVTILPVVTKDLPISLSLPGFRLTNFYREMQVQQSRNSSTKLVQFYTYGSQNKRLKNHLAENRTHESALFIVYNVLIILNESDR